MTPGLAEFLQTLLIGRAGFVLGASRLYLVENRLGPVARREGFDSVEALITALQGQATGALAWSVIEAMVSTETHFFRDRTPFDQFAGEIVPLVARARPGGRVRVWSAGCSTGQEPYSLAIAAREAGHPGLDIVATDIAQRCLEKAQAGLYTQFEVQRGLSAKRLLRWFDKVEDMWQLRADLRAQVQFRRANLLDDPAPLAPEGGFDAIFCRQVLGDMAPERRAHVLDGFSRVLADHGVLYLGLSETVGEGAAFRPVAGRRGLYVKATRAVRAA